MQVSVKFPNNNWEIAANLHLPDDFDKKRKYAAIVCVHPGSSVKEQTVGIYASKLSQEGFVAVAFDASCQGESEGIPRYLENPAFRVEDIRCAIDYLTTLDFVDNECIGLIGVCAGGGYAANAALTERRIKSVVAISPTNIGRAYREYSNLETLEAVGRQHTAEANGAAALITNWTPTSVEEARQAGMTDLDLLEAIDYYRTARGGHPNSNNKFRFTSIAYIMAFDAFHLAEYLLTQPLLVIVGDKVGSFGAYRDGFDLYNKAASKEKSIHTIKEASHYDLYDQPWATAEAIDKIIPFLKKTLSVE